MTTTQKDYSRVEMLNKEIEALRPYAMMVANGSTLQTHKDRAARFVEAVSLRDHLDQQ
jgi:hypothetical protein